MHNFNASIMGIALPKAADTYNKEIYVLFPNILIILNIIFQKLYCIYRMIAMGMPLNKICLE